MLTNFPVSSQVPPHSRASGSSCTGYPLSPTSSTVCSPPAWPITPSSARPLNSSSSTLPPAKHASNTCPPISTQQVVTLPTKTPQLIANSALLLTPMSTWHNSTRNTRPDGVILESCGHTSSSTFSPHWGCIGTLGFRESKRFKRRRRLICRERRPRHQRYQRWRLIIMRRLLEFGKTLCTCHIIVH